MALLPAPGAFVPRLPSAKVMAASPDQLARRLQQNMLLHRGTGSATQTSRSGRTQPLHACMRSAELKADIISISRDPYPLCRLTSPPPASAAYSASCCCVRRSVPAATSSAPAAVALADAPTSTEQAAGAADCPRGHQWQVHKFGGTCVSAAERIQRVAQLVVDASAESQQARNHRPALRHPLSFTGQLAATTCLAWGRDPTSARFHAPPRTLPQPQTP